MGALGCTELLGNLGISRAVLGQQPLCLTVLPAEGGHWAHRFHMGGTTVGQSVVVSSARLKVICTCNTY